jgi:ribosomal protein S18 acetylase RimI-like enzyme
MLGQARLSADKQLQRMAASLQAWQRALGRAAAGGRVIEVGELVASVVPAARSRSLLNAAVLSHRAALDADALSRLAEGYRAAGGEVWGVWVHESNRAARTILKQAGFALDSHPAAMAIELGALAFRPAAPGVEVERTDDLALIAQPLGAGYGFPPEFLTQGLPGLLEHCEGWVARIAGVPAAGLLIVTHDSDAGVVMVATAPEHRRRGAASHALRIALLDAGQRGFATSTLQASAMGEPVYAGLGYRNLGTLELWERRGG